MRALPSACSACDHVMKRPPTVCLIACDVSADQNAARLAHAIRARSPQVRLFGIGGSYQEEAGVDVMLRTTHLSFMGVLGAVRHLPALTAHFRRALSLVEDLHPDLAVIVDAEVVGCPFAARLRRHAIPTALFFPPHVWFWGAWRAPFVASVCKRVISAFRHEAMIYERAGIDTVWVGHPLRDAVVSHGNRAAALHAIGLDPERPVVVLMPGSRHNEIVRLMPPFVGAAQRLQARDPRLQFALPVASSDLRSEIEARAARSGLRDLTLCRPASYDVMAAADVIVQSSGTATLEAALLRVPSVIAYRCLTVEYLVARLIMRVPFIGLPNILLDEMVQPEFFQHDVDASHLAAAAWPLLTDEARRASIRSKLARLPDMLGQPGVLDRTAAAVLDLLPASTITVAPDVATELSSVA